MHHEAAKAIFTEIRDRPYAWSTVVGKSAPNCYFKGIELLQRLGILGYAVRGRVGETFLGQNIPREIRDLYPSQFPLTHFWVEVQLEERWHILDASYDPPLSKAGFKVNEWSSDMCCFEITKSYTQEEVITYQAQWHSPQYAQSYFAAIAPCATALNRWFETIRLQHCDDRGGR